MNVIGFAFGFFFISDVLWGSRALYTVCSGSCSVSNFVGKEEMKKAEIEMTAMETEISFFFFTFLPVLKAVPQPMEWWSWLTNGSLAATDFHNFCNFDVISYNCYSFILDKKVTLCSLKQKKFSKHHDFSAILVDSFTTKTYVVQFHYDTVSSVRLEKL